MPVMIFLFKAAPGYRDPDSDLFLLLLGMVMLALTIGLIAGVIMMFKIKS